MRIQHMSHMYFIDWIASEFRFSHRSQRQEVETVEWLMLPFICNSYYAKFVAIRVCVAAASTECGTRHDEIDFRSNLWWRCVFSSAIQQCLWCWDSSATAKIPNRKICQRRTAHAPVYADHSAENGDKSTIHTYTIVEPKFDSGPMHPNRNSIYHLYSNSRAIFLCELSAHFTGLASPLPICCLTEDEATKKIKCSFLECHMDFVSCQKPIRRCCYTRQTMRCAHTNHNIQFSASSADLHDFGTDFCVTWRMCVRAERRQSRYLDSTSTMLFILIEHRLCLWIVRTTNAILIFVPLLASTRQPSIARSTPLAAACSLCILHIVVIWPNETISVRPNIYPIDLFLGPGLVPWCVNADHGAGSVSQDISNNCWRRIFDSFTLIRLHCLSFADCWRVKCAGIFQFQMKPSIRLRGRLAAIVHNKYVNLFSLTLFKFKSDVRNSKLNGLKSVGRARNV